MKPHSLDIKVAVISNAADWVSIFLKFDGKAKMARFSSKERLVELRKYLNKILTMLNNPQLFFFTLSDALLSRCILFGLFMRFGFVTKRIKNNAKHLDGIYRNTYLMILAIGHVYYECH
jgi:hypothetical protein